LAIPASWLASERSHGSGRDRGRRGLPPRRGASSDLDHAGAVGASGFTPAAHRTHRSLLLCSGGRPAGAPRTPVDGTRSNSASTPAQAGRESLIQADSAPKRRAAFTAEWENWFADHDIDLVLDALGLTPERTRQIEAGALRKLREALAAGRSEQPIRAVPSARGRSGRPKAPAPPLVRGAVRVCLRG
jgi:hypothetical protein